MMKLVGSLSHWPGPARRQFFFAIASLFTTFFSIPNLVRQWASAFVPRYALPAPPASILYPSLSFHG